MTAATMVVSDSDRALVERADARFARMGSAACELLADIAEIDRRAFHERDGYQSSAAYVSARYGISQWAARRWINAGHSLALLPRVTEALRTGVLSLDKVLELVRLATPEDEAKLITWSRRVSAAAIRKRADREARKDIEDVRDASRDRFFRWWTGDDDIAMHFEGLLPAAEGAEIAATITRLADRVPELPTNPDDRLEPGGEAGFEARCADALSLLAAGGALDQAEPATVVVHTTLSRILSEESRAYIEGGPVLHPEVARRLSCDARLSFVLEGVEGDPIGIGRASRNVPRWLRRQLNHRDGGCCTFPGCNRTTFLQAHHIWHWEHGGPTDLDNLILVCSFHHKLVHDFGWGVTLTGSQTTWYRPSGRRFEPGPAPPAEQPQPQILVSA